MQAGGFDRSPGSHERGPAVAVLYRIAESVPLAQRHAGHLIDKLKRERAA